MRESSYDARWWHSVTTQLLVANTIVFILQGIDHAYLRQNLFAYLQLSPKALFHGHIYQLLTFQFLHASFFHFFFNSIVLFFLGRMAESMLGRARFLEVYFASGALGGLLQAILGVAFPNTFGGATVGASAGISALLAVICVLEPDQTFYVQFIIPVRARTLLYGSLAISIFLIVVPVEPGIAHGAHLGGLLGGMAYVHWILRRERRLFDWRPYATVQPRRSRPLVGASVKKSLWGKSVAGKEEAPPTEDLPPAEFISREVDPILDKISAHGIQSLTERERRILEAARRKMARR